MENQESIFDTLEREGWKRQFVANEPRLSEAVELYKESGFEVHLESVPKAQGLPDCQKEGMTGSGCTVCFDGQEDQYKIIFTRPGKDDGGGDDNLF